MWTDRFVLRRSTHLVSKGLAIAMVLALAAPIFADAPGRGRTAAFEINYLRFIINHHASAVRMTELAAGTDVGRDAALNPSEGTAPTPGYPSTPAKATMTEIRSMARAENGMQREEIGAALRMLKERYGVDHTPQASAEGQRLIQLLESTPAGGEFDKAFLMAFSWHHYGALQPSNDCQINRELMHDDLDRYCRGIVHAQTSGIIEMRTMLCKQFGVCDFQPSEVPR